MVLLWVDLLWVCSCSILYFCFLRLCNACVMLGCYSVVSLSSAFASCVSVHLQSTFQMMSRNLVHLSMLRAWHVFVNMSFLHLYLYALSVMFLLCHCVLLSHFRLFVSFLMSLLYKEI
jgi:hypothetical protein